MNDLAVTYNATPAHGLYAVLRDPASGDAWDGSAWVAWDDADLADYAIALSALGGDLWAADVPAGVTAGTYAAYYYEQAGGAPATSDLLLRSEAFYWSGTAASEPTGDAVGDYIAETDIVTRRGAILEKILSDPDGLDVKRTVAIQAAIDDAEDEFRSFFGSDGRLTQPVTFASGTPSMVVGWLVTLAIRNLEKSRPDKTDANGTAAPTYEGQAQKVRRQMAMYKRPPYTILPGATLDATADFGPRSLTPGVDACGVPTGTVGYYWPGYYALPWGW